MAIVQPYDAKLQALEDDRLAKLGRQLSCPEKSYINAPPDQIHPILFKEG